MTPEAFDQIEQLYHAALALEPQRRAAFLSEACGADEGLRRQVERLLAGHERAGDFLNAPVAAVPELLAQASSRDLSGRRLGHYRVISLLGRGGMGEVYLAEDLLLERKVALKLLPAEFTADAERVRRFEREAKAASALNHPNILTIYEIGEAATEDGDVHFIATEFIAGCTLRQLLRDRRLSLGEALDVAAQVASALAAAHASGIVHRDLKPENVMVRPDGLVKVLDFGLAKSVRRRPAQPIQIGAQIPAQVPEQVKTDTEPGAVMGTVSYMSPEQARGMEVDARTDIFSFGILLYELLAGSQPFTGASASDVMAEILKTEPAPLAEAAPGTPRELERIVSRALRKDREERYPTGAEMLAELKSLKQKFDSAGLAASASGAAPLLGQVQRRRRALFIALAALVVVAGALFFYFRRTPVLTEKDTILLADFANTTGEAVFDGTLRQALAVQLEQTPFLKLFSDEQARTALRLMERKPDERVTREVALEICRRRGLKAALVGSIAKFDRSYAITLEAIDGRSGATISSALAEAEGKDRVLRALEQAANELRRKLGESLASIEQFNAPLEEATTKSLDALNAFSLGMEQQRLGNQLAAILHFRRAIEFDSDFALAYAQLAPAYTNTAQPALSAEAAEQAYRRRERASERERLMIEAVYYSNTTREFEKWFETVSLIAQTYPREAVPHSQMAFYHNLLGQPERALAEAREAVRLSGGDVAANHVPLATALIRLNRFDEAKAAIRQAQARKLDVAGYHLRLYQIGFVQGDSTLLEEQLDWARGKADEYQALEWQAQTAAFAGRLRVARSHSQRAMELARQRNFPDAAAGLALEAALRQSLTGDERMGKGVLAAARALAAIGAWRGRRDNSPLPVGPLALAMCGDVGQAQRNLDEVARRNPHNLSLQSVGLPVVRAAIALRGARPDQAVELLEPARAYEAGAHFWPNYLRGRAYLDLRRGAESEAEFRKIIDHRGWDPTSMLWPLAHLGLARAAALQGDAAQSRRSYDEFFGLWRESDVDLPLLLAARREYEKLR